MFSSYAFKETALRSHLRRSLGAPLAYAELTTEIADGLGPHNASATKAARTLTDALRRPSQPYPRHGNRSTGA